jgi:hypothetical protein
MCKSFFFLLAGAVKTNLQDKEQESEVREDVGDIIKLTVLLLLE